MLFSKSYGLVLASVAKNIAFALQLWLYSYFLPNDAIGISGVLLAVIAVVSSTHDFALSRIIISYKILDALRLSSFLCLGVIVSLGLSAIFIILWAFQGEVFGVSFDLYLGLLVLLNVLFNTVYVLSRSLLELDLKVRSLIGIELLTSVAMLFAAMLLPMVVSSDLVILLASALGLAVSSAGAVLLSGLFRKIVAPKIRTSLPYLKNFVFSASESGLASLLLYLDLFVVNYFFGLEVGGAYYIGRQICLKLSGVVFQPLSRISLPLLVKSDAAGRLRIYRQAISLTGLLVCPAFIAILFFASELISVLHINAMKGSEYVLSALALWALLRVMGSYVGLLVYAHQQVERAFYWVIFVVAIALPVYIIAAQGLSLFGFLNVLIAFQAAILLTSWWRYVSHYLGLGLLSGLSVSLEAAAVSVTAVAISYFISFLNLSQELQLLLKIVSFGLVYLAYWWFRYNNSASVRQLFEVDEIKSS